jgi:putative PIN family toxin of toxin-antitoxin system
MRSIIGIMGTSLRPEALAIAPHHIHLAPHPILIVRCRSSHRMGKQNPVPEPNIDEHALVARKRNFADARPKRKRIGFREGRESERGFLGKNVIDVGGNGAVAHEHHHIFLATWQHIRYHPKMIVVVDTNVLVSAVMSPDGASREIIRRCFRGQFSPLLGASLVTEYEDVFHRDNLFDPKLISKQERQAFLEAFALCCRWVKIYFLWRPNLRDEADNHIIELAFAGGASHIITMNQRDFRQTQLTFSDIQIVTPADALKIGDGPK